MLNETIITTPSTKNVTPGRRISWTAVFVGALVGVGLSFLLSLFGAAIGLSIFSMSDGNIKLAIGGLIGIIISIIVSMLATGYTAGYLGRLYCPLRNLGILYGFVTWILTLIISALITTHMSSYVPVYYPMSSQISAASQQPEKANKTGTEATTNTSSPLTVKPNSTAGNAQHIITVNASPSTLAWSAFTVFILFFIGALFTCIGACWGMSCKRDD